MSTLGKVCLVTTLLLMLMAMAPIPAPWGGWTPRLLVIHNQWSEKLREAKQKAEAASLANQTARQELYVATADLKGVTLGWDRYWTIPARDQAADAQAPTITRQNDHLIVRNLGAVDGLDKLEYQENGQPQLVDPVVHAFYGNSEGFTYAGEFRAINIAAKQVELEPVHAPLPGEAATWNVNATWRLRALVPTGLRATVDDLYHHRQRTAEMTQQTDANIVRQQKLLKSAQNALAIRKDELLGNPDLIPIPASPEFHLGLLQVNEDVEEERNQLLLDLDNLRRSIKVAVENRSERLEQMNQRVTRLPGANSQFASAKDGAKGSAE